MVIYDDLPGIYVNTQVAETVRRYLEDRRVKAQEAQLAAAIGGDGILRAPFSVPIVAQGCASRIVGQYRERRGDHYLVRMRALRCKQAAGQKVVVWPDDGAERASSSVTGLGGSRK